MPAWRRGQADVTEPSELRQRLVAGLRASGALHDDRVAAALTDVPRHAFLPGIEPARAYQDDAVITKMDAEGRPISSSSQPAIMALMLQQLAVQPGHRVLEIGAGTGYNAALLAHLAGGSGEVTTVDLDEDIVTAARGHLAACGFGRVSVVQATAGLAGRRTRPTTGSSDRRSLGHRARPGFGQLSPPGRLVLPLALRAGMQYSVAFEQGADHLDSVSVLPCGFMRLRGAFASPETHHPARQADRASWPRAPPGPPARKTWGPARPSPARPSAPEYASRSRICTAGSACGWPPASRGSAGCPRSALQSGPGLPGATAAATVPGGRAWACCPARTDALPWYGWTIRPARTPGRPAVFELGACPFGREGPGSRHGWPATSGTGCRRAPLAAGPADRRLPGGGQPARRAQATVIDKRHTRLLITWPGAESGRG